MENVHQSVKDMAMKAIEALEQVQDPLYKSFNVTLEGIRSRHPELQEELFTLEEILVGLVVGTSEELYGIGFKQAVNVVKNDGFNKAVRIIEEPV